MTHEAQNSNEAKKDIKAEYSKKYFNAWKILYFLALFSLSVVLSAYLVYIFNFYKYTRGEKIIVSHAVHNLQKTDDIQKAIRTDLINLSEQIDSIKNAINNNKNAIHKINSGYLFHTQDVEKNIASLEENLSILEGKLYDISQQKITKKSTLTNSDLIDSTPMNDYLKFLFLINLKQKIYTQQPFYREWKILLASSMWPTIQSYLSQEDIKQITLSAGPKGVPSILALSTLLNTLKAKNLPSKSTNVPTEEKKETTSNNSSLSSKFLKDIFHFLDIKKVKNYTPKVKVNKKNNKVIKIKNFIINNKCNSAMYTYQHLPANLKNSSMLFEKKLSIRCAADKLVYAINKYMQKNKINNFK